MTRSRVPLLARAIFAITLLVGAGTALSACDSGRASEAAYEEYFRLLAAEMAAFDAAIGEITATQAGLDQSGLSAGLGAYAGQLEFHATAIEEMDAPGETAKPQRKFVTAFRYLRDVKILQSEELVGIDSGLSDEELVERVDKRSSEWSDLCHDLQDIALTRELEVDLQCVTALHRSP